MIALEVEKFTFHGGDEAEDMAAILHVSARPSVAANRAKSRGALIDIWTDSGRYRLTLSAAQLTALRVELAKQSPAIALVEGKQ